MTLPVRPRPRPLAGTSPTPRPLARTSPVPRARTDAAALLERGGAAKQPKPQPKPRAKEADPIKEAAEDK